MFKQSCPAYKSDYIRICRPLFCFMGKLISPGCREALSDYNQMSKCIKLLLIKLYHCIISINSGRESD